MVLYTQLSTNRNGRSVCIRHLFLLHPCLLENSLWKSKLAFARPLRCAMQVPSCRCLSSFFTLFFFFTLVHSICRSHTVFHPLTLVPKVYVKSRGTDCKNSDIFYILHRICVHSIGINFCTKIFQKYSIFFCEKTERKNCRFLALYEARSWNTQA